LPTPFLRLRAGDDSVRMEHHIPYELTVVHERRRRVRVMAVECVANVTGWQRAEHSRNRLEESIMATGTVKWFNGQKGFGFIEQENGGPDVFAHYSNIAAQGYRELQEGQKVSFDITQGPKGPQAENICPV
jgi:cold shock protein